MMPQRGGAPEMARPFSRGQMRIVSTQEWQCPARCDSPPAFRKAFTMLSIFICKQQVSRMLKKLIFFTKNFSDKSPVWV